MFWIVLSLGAFALTFVKLGVFSVLVKVLTAALGVAVFVIAALGLALIWRKVFGSKSTG